MTSGAPRDNNWQIVEDAFHLEAAQLYETLFALGNGYLGMRGTFEEGLSNNSVEGTFINGFYESAPIVYGEKFIGFAENKQTILNLANAKVIRLEIAGEPFNLLEGEILEYQRSLDLREGVLRRKVRWQSALGKQVQVDAERLVSQTRSHLGAIRYRVTPLNFSGTLTLFAEIDGVVRQSEHAEDDPRLGTQFKNEVLKLVDKKFSGETALMAHRTLTTQLTAGCGIQVVSDTAGLMEAYEDLRAIGFKYTFQAKQGIPLTLDKFMVYASSLDTDESQLLPFVRRQLESAAAAGYEAVAAEQRTYMAAFWEAADIVIEGNNLLQRGIRFNMFHLLNSVGRDGHTAIAAKGLTGLGYEGHYFWDTEIYILPFFLYTRPEISRKLLEYRYHILEKARQRARQMAHRSGALYAWRTINGEECSANFPTGTAQYHINADIAFAIWRYYDATQDNDFMKRFGAEILCETARLWLEAGDTIPEGGGKFCINAVTGPDEYQILVNNNAYTNLMARQNLRFAAEIVSWLRQVEPDAYASLAQKIALQDSEPAAWAEAAMNMYIPYDGERGIIAQDDTFLTKAVWDFEHTPKENYPLLLHYHPLVVMRYQVCKQADTVLAEFLLHDQFDPDQKQRDFDYYEPLTTHDSSLSTAVFGIMAAELGYLKKAESYFAETAIMDLENKHNNTQAGIHAANMAGAWQGIVFGFGGMRAKDGLSFNPKIPQGWQSYSFKVRYRGRTVGVQVKTEGATYRLLEGDPMSIKVGEKTIHLEAA